MPPLQYAALFAGVVAGYYGTRYLRARAQASRLRPFLNPAAGAIVCGALLAAAAAVVSPSQRPNEPITWSGEIVQVRSTADLAAFTAAHPHERVLLMAYANWCGICHSSTDIVNAAAKSGVPVAAFNIDVARDLTGRFDVAALPVFILMQDGRELGRLFGRQDLSTLLELTSISRAG